MTDTHWFSSVGILSFTYSALTGQLFWDVDDVLHMTEEVISWCMVFPKYRKA